MNKINYEDISFQTHKSHSLQKNRQCEQALTFAQSIRSICPTWCVKKSQQPHGISLRFLLGLRYSASTRESTFYYLIIEVGYNVSFEAKDYANEC